MICGIQELRAVEGTQEMFTSLAFLNSALRCSQAVYKVRVNEIARGALTLIQSNYKVFAIDIRFQGVVTQVSIQDVFRALSFIKNVPATCEILAGRRFKVNGMQCC